MKRKRKRCKTCHQIKKEKPEKKKSIWHSDVEEKINKIAKQIGDGIYETGDNVRTLPISEYSGKEFTFIFLTLIAVGAVMGAFIIAPNIGIIFKIFGAKSRKDQERIRQAIRRYKRRGLIQLKNGKIMVTADGNRLLSTYQARNLFFKKPQKWDGKWRMVMFDIPGKYENERKIVREQLKEFGFRTYQDSVFVSPYECEKIIKTLKNHLALDGYMRYVTVQSFDQEEKFKKLFKLQ